MSAKTYDIVGLKMYVVYDVVGAYRIRCRMSLREHTMSCVSYDIVYFLYFAQNLRHRRYTYDVVCMTYYVVRLNVFHGADIECWKLGGRLLVNHGNTAPLHETVWGERYWLKCAQEHQRNLPMG